MAPVICVAYNFGVPPRSSAAFSANGPRSGSVYERRNLAAVNICGSIRDTFRKNLVGQHKHSEFPNSNKCKKK